MHRTLCTLSLLALIGSAVPSIAQTTPPTPTKPQPSMAPSAGDEMKLTGCVKEGPTTGSAPAGAGSKYIFETMKPKGTGAPGSMAPPPAADASARSAMGDKQTYTLMAAASVDLSKHVNHLVELTGTKAKMDHGAAPSMPSPSGSGGMAHGAGEPAMFHVTALRMVSASCNQATQ